MHLVENKFLNFYRQTCVFQVLGVGKAANGDWDHVVSPNHGGEMGRDCVSGVDVWTGAWLRHAGIVPFVRLVSPVAMDS